MTQQLGLSALGGEGHNVFLSPWARVRESHIETGFPWASGGCWGAPLPWASRPEQEQAFLEPLLWSALLWSLLPWQLYSLELPGVCVCSGVGVGETWSPDPEATCLSGLGREASRRCDPQPERC